MDGNKKIGGIVFAGIIALVITSCKVQQPGYVGLYLDNSISVNDTIDPGEGPLNMVDTAITQVVNPIAGMKAGLPVSLRPAEEVFGITSDSVYQYEVNELLEGISDSIQLLRHQIIVLQDQHVIQPDTNVPGKIVYKDLHLDSLQPEFELEQLIQIQNDTIARLRNQVTLHDKSAGLKADTVYITKETVKLIKGDSLQPDYETTQLGNDTIAYLRKQVNDLQSSGSIKPDTIYVFKETAKLPGVESRQTDLMTLQLINTKDEQIQRLQNQLNAMQAAAATAPQQTQIFREPAQAMLPGSQQTDHLTLQLLQAKNDTILLLRSQLYNMRLQTPASDTVIVENETNDTQSAKELFSEQETADLFQALQDSMQLLKTMVLSLGEQLIPGVDTTTLSSQGRKDVPSPAITDTILLVAYYELGEIKPLEEESILNQIKELCSNDNVMKISLSGYTDSSGNELINREITNTRLNYLLERIKPWIAREKVFFQNFGDSFASDTMVTEERKIEIRIQTE